MLGTIGKASGHWKGFRTPTRRNPILKLVLKGARRIHAKKRSITRHRRPITLEVLRTLITSLNSSSRLNQYDKHILRAAFTLAFYGLLRISEFTVPSRRAFDPRRHATMANISWGSQHYTLTVNCKTDQLGHGHRLYIPKATGVTCPFKAMRRYCSNMSNANRAPLFKFTTGEPLTRGNFLTYLRKFLSQAGYPQVHLTHTVSESVQPL